jgi:Protein kinase domain
MSRDPELAARFERFVEHHVLHGTALPLEVLCDGREDLAASLDNLVARYLDLSSALESGSAALAASPATPGPLPAFDGFRTVERLGAGGMGEVFKLHDLTLDRLVAAKVLRQGREAAARLGDFLREARAMALFQDRRIVQIHEFRPDADPPVIIMEYVDGFDLARVAPSLEYRQRARIVEEVCEAIQHAHDLGIQHRDLKPSNILLDGTLAPKILDFGLSAGEPSRGHLRGTAPYLAPEQLDPDRPIDARSDVYALGVILYELLCGTVPYSGSAEEELLAAIRGGRPRLPVEIEPTVPEPLQAVALKAMERDPALRYQSAREIALDLARYRTGRAVLARPSQYASALETRLGPHVAEIDEWERIRLIYPHEAARLRGAYQSLEAREDDWIVASRALSYSQIALYLGAFLLMAGSLFYFGAHRFYEAVTGVARPFVVLALPFLGLNLAAHYLYRREHRAVAVAFYLGGITLLPLFLLILFHETRLWVVAAGTPGQLFTDAEVSNRQLQVTVLAACLWAAFLALRTRTSGLSTVFTILVFLLALSVLADVGLRDWFEAWQFDRFALHLAPLVPVYGALGLIMERTGRRWFGRPLYVGAALTLVLVLEFLAQKGRMFAYLGLSMERILGTPVNDPQLLDTLAAMTLNGVLMYCVVAAVERFGPELMARTSRLLLTLSPYATLKPLGYLCQTGNYSRTFDWVYLALALGCALVSRRRQRKSFYYAGIINTGWALWIIASHQRWFDKPLWAIVLIAAGLAGLALGFGLATRERRQSS